MKDTNIIKHTGLFLLVLVLGFLSYNYNLFRFVDPQLVEFHDPVSRELINMGIETYEQGENTSIQMGKITEDPETGEKSFKAYRSQFGPQLWVIVKFFGGSRDAYESGLAFALALVVAIGFLGLRLNMGGSSAWIYAVILISAPWLIMFARHPYWVMFLLLLPSSIALLFGGAAVHSRGWRYLLLALLGASFFAKFVCGYEYMTTLGLSAVVPLCYYELKNSSHKFSWIWRSAQALVVFLLAFALALVVHSKRLDSDSLSEGITEVFSVVAARRLVDEGGSGRIQTAIQTPYHILAVRYALAPSMLPYLNTAFTEDERIELKAASDELNRGNIKAVYEKLMALSTSTKLFILGMFGGAAFVMGTVFIGIALAALEVKRLAIPILLAFLAPVSWFLGVKGHSGIHYQLNYVLWYVIFIPFVWAVFALHANDLFAQVRAKLKRTRHG